MKPAIKAQAATGATDAAPAPSPFFQLEANYLIAPGASIGDLINDFRCLHGAGMGALDAAIEADCESDSPAMWAGVYMLRQAFAVFDEIESALHAHGAVCVLPSRYEDVGGAA